MQLSHRIHTAFSLLALSVLGAAALAASPAEAQRRCDTRIKKPYICNIDLVASVRGESERVHVRNGEVPVPARGVTILSIRPEDQFGEGYPAKSFSYRLRVDDACRGLVEVQEERTGELRLIPRGHGSCTLVIAPANQPELDMRLRLVVGDGAYHGAPIGSDYDDYDDDYATATGEPAIIARWLYRAILGREGEPSGIDAAAADIARGRTEEVVDRMLASAEYSESRRGLSAVQLLDRIYQGLLGRPADGDGQRSYTNDIIRGQTDEVIEEIMDSEEFEARLGRADLRR